MITPLNRNKVRDCLEKLDLRPLFIEELGWDHGGENVEVVIAGHTFSLRAIAHKRGMVVFQYIAESENTFPDYPTRQKIEKAVAKIIREHMIVYAPADRTAQYWQWVKREPGQPDRSRAYKYHLGQSGEPLIQRLEHLVFTLEEEDDLTIVDVSGRVRAAFDMEQVTKRFYDRFKKEHDAFLGFIEGMESLADREWYTSLMLNRMMFIYFIQKRGFLDGDPDYLRHRLEFIRREQKTDKFLRFYRLFLLRLFHEGLGQPEANRSPELAALLGQVPYLNGGLFDVHDLERDYLQIHIPDEAFQRIFSFFDAYQWHLDDRPLRNDNEINPDVLGYIFEKYINQKELGAYYTKEDITGYISRNTVIPFLFDHARRECPIAFKSDGGVWRLLQDNPDRYFHDAVRHGITYDIHRKEELENKRHLPPEIAAGVTDVSRRDGWKDRIPDDYGLPTETWREYLARRKRYEEVYEKLAAGHISSINDLVTYNLDIEKFAQDVIAQSEGPELVRAFWKAINTVSILDPTCGSGAFLFAALNILEPLYVACLAAMRGFLDDLDRSVRRHHPHTMNDFRKVLKHVSAHTSERYFILKAIVIGNLYGVDIMEEAVEICKLRLFLKLVAQLDSYEQIEPLPDIDFNIRAGNTLVGFASLNEVKRALDTDLIKKLALPEIEARAEKADHAFRLFREMQTKNDMNANTFSDVKHGLRERLDDLRKELDRYLACQDSVKTNNNAVFAQWHRNHQPFHWFVEFYGIMRSGGFDVIVGNPPYIEIPKSLSRSMLVDSFGTALERWSRDEDVYVLVVERSEEILSESGKLGMILPLSLTFSTKRPFNLLRKNLSEEQGEWWWSSFDRIPSSLFGSDVRTRCTVSILSRSQNRSSWCGHTTQLNRWEAEARNHLFDTLSYADFSSNIEVGVPKVASEIQARTLTALLASGRTLASNLKNPISHSRLSSSAPDFPDQCVFVGGTAYNWFPAWREIPETITNDGKPSLPARTIGFQFDDNETANIVFAFLCSSLGYWWWAIASDGFNLKKWLLLRFPLSTESLMQETRGEIAKFGEALRQELRKHYVYKENVGRIGNFFLPACSSQILDIDDALSRSIAELSDDFFEDIREFNVRFSRSTTF